MSMSSLNSRASFGADSDAAGQEESAFQNISLRNRRLRFPLTKVALARLSALVSRFSLAFGDSEPQTAADLEPPDPEDQPEPEPSKQRSGILDDLDENAFRSSRSACSSYTSSLA